MKVLKSLESLRKSLKVLQSLKKFENIWNVCKSLKKSWGVWRSLKTPRSTCFQTFQIFSDSSRFVAGFFRLLKFESFFCSGTCASLYDLGCSHTIYVIVWPFGCIFCVYSKFPCIFATIKLIDRSVKFVTALLFFSLSHGRVNPGAIL